LRGVADRFGDTVNGYYKPFPDGFTPPRLEKQASIAISLLSRLTNRADTLASKAGLLNIFGQIRTPRLADLTAIKTYLGAMVENGSVNLTSILDIRKTQKPLALINNKRNSLAPCRFESE
jgi:hypothetical protein